MSQLKCVVVTPEATALEQEASFIVLPLFDGEIGIAPGRGPMIGRLGYGEMRLKSANGIERYYLDGGFVQIANNVVSVLTGKAIKAGKIAVQAAETQLQDAAKRPIGTRELLDIRDRLVQQARAQIRVARRS